MPCEPLQSICWGRIYGPTDISVQEAVCHSLLNGYTNGDAGASGEVLDRQVSGFKVQLELSLWK